jgi:CDP-diacylglycerol--glycerol-3-phosphate 3-phosphatidyltransferase
MWLNTVLAILFGVLSLTDFLDGFFARRYQQVTNLGKLLDPIADKFLFYSALISLLAAEKIYFYWVVVLIGREFFVMGIRQIALENNLPAIPVSWLGKIKTAIQMACIFFIILNPYQAQGFFGNSWNAIEYLLLFTTTALSLLSARSYYLSFLKEYSKRHPEQQFATDPLFQGSLEDEFDHDLERRN